jgi:plastocyanin
MALGLAACGVSTPGSIPQPLPSPTAMTSTPWPTPTSTSPVERIRIRLFRLQPEILEIPAGTTVVWINEDATTHTVTSGKPEAPSGLFDSGPLEQGRSFSWTFRQAGEYPYFCQRHTHMQGIIRVR